MSEMSLTIAQLDLEPDVKVKAEELASKAPGVVFTSGRRTISQQANAMAQNVVQNRRYVQETYRASKLRDALQRWVDAHPTATEAGIANGFFHILTAWSPADLRHLSAHLTGRAFDIEPHSAPAAEVVALSPRQFLTSEAGLPRWHVGF
jgi:hypothetical protein